MAQEHTGTLRYTASDGFRTLVGLTLASFVVAVVLLIVSGEIVQASIAISGGVTMGIVALWMYGRDVIRVEWEPDGPLVLAKRNRADRYPAARVQKVTRYASMGTRSSGSMSFYTHFVIDGEGDPVDVKVKLDGPNAPDMEAIVRALQTQNPSVDAHHFWEWTGPLDAETPRFALRIGNVRYRRKNDQWP